MVSKSPAVSMAPYGKRVFCHLQHTDARRHHVMKCPSSTPRATAHTPHKPHSCNHHGDIAPVGGTPRPRVRLPMVAHSGDKRHAVELDGPLRHWDHITTTTAAATSATLAATSSAQLRLTHDTNLQHPHTSTHTRTPHASNNQTTTTRTNVPRDWMACVYLVTAYI